MLRARRATSRAPQEIVADAFVCATSLDAERTLLQVTSLWSCRLHGDERRHSRARSEAVESMLLGAARNRFAGCSPQSIGWVQPASGETREEERARTPHRAGLSARQLPCTAHVGVDRRAEPTPRGVRASTRRVGWSR